MDKANAKRQRAADRARDRIKDRRRIKVLSVPTGEVARIAPEGATRSLQPGATRAWSPSVGEAILKEGFLNSKIGGTVAVGDLRGAAIYTLALEERLTCPPSCDHWRTCYGNNLHQTRRWVPSEAFERALAREVRDLARRGPVLIRLHVLGDFYSWEYLRLWVELLDELPTLSVFGFTAHPPESKLGAGIARVRGALGQRFAIRHSSRTGEWGSFTIDFPTDRKRYGDAIICPEQRSAMEGDNRKHCANCAACWQTSRPIIFIEH